MWKNSRVHNSKSEIITPVLKSMNRGYMNDRFINNFQINEYTSNNDIVQKIFDMVTVAII